MTANPVPVVVANLAALTLSKVATSSALFLWQIALARALGVADYGVYGAISALMAVGAAIPDAGIGTIFVREVARKPERSGPYLTAALAVHVPLAVVAYLSVQLAAFLLGYDLRLRMLLALAGANLLLDALGTAGHNVFIARERMAWAAAISVLHAVVLVGAGAIALWSGGGLQAVYVVVIAASLARMTAYWLALGRRGWTPAPELERRLAGRLLRSGSPLGVAALLALALTHIDKLATTAIVGVEATGQFMAAFVVVFGAVDLLAATTLPATLPAMSRPSRDRDRTRSHTLLGQLVLVDLLCAIPLAVLLTVLGPAGITFLYGPAYAGAGIVLQVMGWSIVTRTIEGALAQSLIIHGRQTSVLGIRTCGLALNLAVTLLLLPRIGIVGAAIGMIAGEVCIIALALWGLSLPADWWTRIGRQSARLVAPTAALALVSVWLRGVVSVPACAALALGAYAAVALASGAVPREQLAAVTGAMLSGSRSVRARIRAGS